jgi:bacterioferritin
MRTCFLKAIFASSSGVRPTPATLTHSAACGPKRSAAASAMYSGARSGSASMRSQTRLGGPSISLSSAAASTWPESTLRRMASDTGTSASHGILSDELRDDREQLVELLTRAYWMEIETVMSYIANSINPDGVRAQEIIESLDQDVQEELGHARQFGQRIKELYGVVPGSLDFQAEQSYLQPPDHQTDIVHVIKGVIEAESGAIEHYNRVIEFCEGRDPVTQDMVIAILRDEEGHRRLFEGFLREYKAEGLA